MDMERRENNQISRNDNHTGPDVICRENKVIIGTVYDRVKREIIRGAICILIGQSNQNYNVCTDEWGAFCFQNVTGGPFTLVIKAEGFTVKALTGISIEGSVNLGNIPLSW